MLRAICWLSRARLVALRGPVSEGRLGYRVGDRVVCVCVWGGTKSFLDISAKPPREDLEMRTHAVHVSTDTAPLVLILWPGTMAPNRLIPEQLCAVTRGAHPVCPFIYPLYLWTCLPDSLVLCHWKD